jgi:quercetin dioxygenase-like cupin family protein
MEDVRVRKWSSEGRPDEAALRELYEQENLRPYRWSNGPGDVYGVHHHPYHKIIYVVRGSITFLLPDRGTALELFPGDRLDLPAGVRHGADVGPQGVVCLEAHRAAS